MKSPDRCITGHGACGKEKVKALRKRKVRLMFRQAINYFFPPRCPVCDQLLGEGELEFHEKCRKKLQLALTPVCMRCGRPVKSERTEYCPRCSRHPILADQGKALYAYQGAAKIMMYRFKYSNRREYGLIFANDTVHLYRAWLERIHPQCIVPVPMYPAKKKARGYNQAEVFASELSLLSGIPLELDLVKRCRPTEALKTMNGNQRREELKGAFEAAERCASYDTILLLDDIFTTGSTADAVTALLFARGVHHVFVLTVCIADGTAEVSSHTASGICSESGSDRKNTDIH